MDTSLSQLLEKLTRLNVRLRVDGERLVCSAPPAALTPELQDEISQRKPQLLSLLGAAPDHQTQGQGLRRRPTSSGPAPVSFGQERLWLLHQLNPHSFGYNVPNAVRLHGVLRIEALEDALSEIIRRHEILRTTIQLQQGQLVQCVHAPVRVSLSSTRVTALTLDEVERAIHDFVTRMAQTAFDLSQFPYWRFSLLELGPDDHVLVSVQHHIVSDGWSIGILLRELAALYHAYSNRQPSPLPELPIQYGDYAEWQRERLRGERLTALVSWWSTYLADAPRVLDLPTDFPRPAVQSERGDWEVLVLGEWHCQKMQQLCGKHSVTPFMLLLTVYAIFLSRCCDQKDLVIGTPTGNRDQLQCEQLLGIFLNTLVLRFKIEGDPSFLQLVQRVRTSTLDVFSHQELPFEKLVDALRPQRDLSRSPIFQAMFILHNQSAARFDLHDLTIGEVAFDSGTSKVDLTLAATLHEHSAVLTLEYCTALFTSTTVRRMLRQIKTLLTSALEHPELPISELNALPDDEQGLLVTRWNQSTAQYPHEITIDQLIQRQAARTPDRIAVRHLDTQLTYQQLVQRVNQLTAELILGGAGYQQRVAVHLERNLDLVVGTLAVLQAGATYVALDDGFPAERLSFMMQDARVSVILASPSKQAAVSSLGPRVVLTSPPLDAETAPDIPAAAMSRRTSAECAYILYTSGSTGHPKGVMVGHRSVVNFLTSLSQLLGISADDRLLAVTALSFDISILELLLPLTIGAAVVIASATAIKDDKLLLDLVKRESITFMQATPTHWSLLVRGGWSESLDLTALSGGEPLSRQLARDLSERVTAIWNLYGPTETTVWSSAHRVGATDVAPPIGRPIANTRLYCLDQHLRPTPIGVPGELYISGDGLALGYVKRPGRTAETFLPDPFCDQPGARMYRTGDLVRFSGNGQLHYLRRIDRQIKLRGHRIELTEIEHALGNDPAIARAAVDLDQHGTDSALCAWIVPKAGVTPQFEEIRLRLMELLPAYMVPNKLVFVDELPTTPGGKLNRQQLPRTTERPELEQPFVIPRGHLEERIASIWKSTLKVDRVGLHDNFFDLGGHSLLLAAVREELVQTINQELTMVDLFRYPTIAALARHLRRDVHSPTL